MVDLKHETRRNPLYDGYRRDLEQGPDVTPWPTRVALGLGALVLVVGLLAMPVIAWHMAHAQGQRAGRAGERAR